MEIISITTNISRFGGAQKVMLDVHNGLKERYSSKIVGLQSYENLHPKYSIKKEEYVLLRNPWQLNGKILIVHARNLIPFFVIAKKLLFLNTKIIYVSHNVYNTYRGFTIFPDTIVSISQKVTKNLIQYFKCKDEKIHLIYNGISDNNNQSSNTLAKSFKTIKILYPARVNNVKQQLLIVSKLKNKIRNNIEIHFAGIGEDFDELKASCAGSENFKVLGFVENMDSILKEYHYMMLYSLQEGLPLSLIEGAMNGIPLLVNDVGGNLEICEPGINGIHLSDNWDTMVNQLNFLVDITKEQYDSMSLNGREIYLKKFRYDIMIENYTKLIESIAE